MCYIVRQLLSSMHILRLDFIMLCTVFYLHLLSQTSGRAKRPRRCIYCNNCSLIYRTKTDLSDCFYWKTPMWSLYIGCTYSLKVFMQLTQINKFAYLDSLASQNLFNSFVVNVKSTSWSVEITELHMHGSSTQFMIKYCEHYLFAAIYYYFYLQTF